MNSKTFHVGLCMAGSVSAGAYTAGVIDYLMEALEAWEKSKGTDASIPDHRIEIDLLGGSSGGGMTAAMAFFAFRDDVQHASLEGDGKTYHINPEKNIFWKAWVELTGNDVFNEMIDPEDIRDFYIPSALNSSFIDTIAKKFQDYIEDLNERVGRNSVKKETFLSDAAELFMTLFNVTGMKYQLSSKALGATEQYVSEHRDLAHFRWSDTYEGDGRMEISFKTFENLAVLIQASKATGAFPVGLKAREIARKAKYIWDNPFFQKNNKFNKDTINLGDKIQDDEDIYKSLNADGGTSNNEPIELIRDLLLQIRLKEEHNDEKLAKVNAMDDTEKMIAKSQLTNYSVIMVDPFPSYDFDIIEPAATSAHILRYSLDLVFAMNSQLQFDAKEAIEAYDKNNYGLHIIAPSRDDVSRPEYAIACGALGGFGGFLSKEYRIHDYFLGRHNCQSFLRKYFVVDPEEKETSNGKPNEAYSCVKAVLDGYREQAALDRFCFTDEAGKKWVPIIPDVTLEKPINVREIKESETHRKVVYEEAGKLPLYKMDLPPDDFLERYREGIKDRANKIIKNVYDANWIGDLAIKIVAMSLDDKIADAVINKIHDDLKKRNLMRSS